MNLDDALRTFIAESRGLLADMEDALMQLERVPDDAEAINAVFRAAHTIKGSAGLFGLDTIVAFTHKAESVLDRARAGSQDIDDELVSLLLRCGDHIARLLDLQESGDSADAALSAEDRALSARLLHLLGDAAPADGTAAAAAGGIAGAEDIWHLSLRLSPDLFREGFDPASFIHHLQTLGRIVHLTTLDDALPALQDLDPESCYLGFEIRLASAADKTAIEAVFDFIRQDCVLHILPPDSRTEDYLRLIEQQSTDGLRLGEILVAAGALTRRELDEALAAQCARAVEHPPLGAILVEEQVVQPELVDAALHRQQDLRQRQATESKLIRVHADKLDSLINLVGELVVASATVSLGAGRNKDRALREAVSVMSRLTEGVRDGAMRLRMVEIGETFGRFRRVVRDVSKELGKDIELVINGAETELDKSVVERLGDPLTHLVRNAMDHGIEPAAVRAARGKPARATVELNACHEAGNIVVEVRDDGGGLDRQRILAKAVERGLVAGDAALSDAEVWALIFEPGFSTAAQVSNLSGRGVGMDVVKRAIEALRGSIEIDSQAGAGTTIRIRLPLTLAIIDAFLMRVGDAHHVVPLDVVLECVEIGAGLPAGQGYFDLRGEALPLLRLREHFELQGQPSRRQNVVIVNALGRKAGLVVDELKGELQAVIKPLGRMFTRVKGISGSTILGTGEVALILDVPSLIQQAIAAQSASRPSAQLSSH